MREGRNDLAPSLLATHFQASSSAGRPKRAMSVESMKVAISEIDPRSKDRTWMAKPPKGREGSSRRCQLGGNTLAMRKSRIADLPLYHEGDGGMWKVASSFKRATRASMSAGAGADRGHPDMRWWQFYKARRGKWPGPRRSPGFCQARRRLSCTRSSVSCSEPVMR